jgi:hypothetical protein
VTSRTVEILVESDGGVFLNSGEAWQGLRVRYRFAPARRYEKFIVVASPGQTLCDLLGVLLTIVANDDGTGFDRRRAVAGANKQLQLDDGAAAA